MNTLKEGDSKFKVLHISSEDKDGYYVDDKFIKPSVFADMIVNANAKINDKRLLVFPAPYNGDLRYVCGYVSGLDLLEDGLYFSIYFLDSTSGFSIKKWEEYFSSINNKVEDYMSVDVNCEFIYAESGEIKAATINGVSIKSKVDNFHLEKPKADNGKTSIVVPIKCASTGNNRIYSEECLKKMKKDIKNSKSPIYIETKLDHPPKANIGIVDPKTLCITDNELYGKMNFVDTPIAKRIRDELHINHMGSYVNLTSRGNIKDSYRERKGIAKILNVKWVSNFIKWVSPSFYRFLDRNSVTVIKNVDISSFDMVSPKVPLDRDKI